MVSAGVRFITYDASFVVLNRLGQEQFPEEVGCIEVMDNVYIRYNATIMPNVKIGESVIIGAGVLVSKDLESNGVYVGFQQEKYVALKIIWSGNSELMVVKKWYTHILTYSITRTYQKPRLKEPGECLRVTEI